MDRKPEHDPVAEPEEGTALADALRPGRGDTALGDDPRGHALLEVTQLWADSILSVRHFGPQGGPVTLSDRPARRAAGLSALLIALFVLGVGGLAVRHLTLEAPPELSPEDEARIAAWAAQPPAPQPPPPPALEPLASDPIEALAERTRARMERELTRAHAAMDEGRAERALLQVPPFHLEEQPGWLALIRDELLPLARPRAERGELPEHWRQALAAVPTEPESLSDPEVARVAEDLALGTVVRRAGDDDPWTLTAGLDPDRVTVAHADGRRETLPPREAVWPWVLDDLEAQAHRELARESARLLYGDALARRSGRGICEGAERLLGFLEESGRAELAARAGWCSLNRGDRAAAEERLADIQGPLDTSVDPDAELVLLRTKARLARLDLDDAIAGGVQDRAEVRAAALAAAGALRAHVIEDLRSPSELRAVARELHHVQLDALHQSQESHVRAAGGLGLLILLLLPLALIVEERRSRRLAGDFFVDASDLPCDPFPLVERTEQGPQVRLPAGSRAQVRREGHARAATGDIALRPGEQLVAHIGEATFVVQQVQSPRGVRGDGPRVDWGYLSVLAALLLISGAFTVVLATADPPPELAVQDSDGRIVRIALTQPDPPTPAVVQPRKEPDAGAGARAPEPEGQRGVKESKLSKARGMRVAVRRDEHNRRMVRTQGLIGAIDRLEDGVFGDGGLSPEVATATGGLIGTQYGDQRGDGLAARGDGTGGGCMSERCAPELLSGVGTDGRRRGRRGDGPGPGDVGDKGDSGPSVGLKDPIVLGSIDKATVDRIVRQHLPSIRRCYEMELGRNPELVGKLSVKFVIARDGGVSQATSRNDTLGNAAVSSCVHERFLRMRFPAPKGGGVVMVNYPLVFDAR